MVRNIRENVLKRTGISKTPKKSDKVLSSSSRRNVSTANIKVIVRVRPPNCKEQGDNSRQIIKVIDDNLLIFDPEDEMQGFFFHGVEQKTRDLTKKVKKNLKFTFDKVYSPESTNNEVFNGTTQSLINSIMDGYNCSVFAYGATGAGKTYTMTGTSKTRGITFLTMNELFKRKAELSNERNFEIGITYLEVYNELVKDLLNPGSPLNLREDANYGVIVAGIKLFKISNPEELFILLEQGNKNRTQHPTDANAESSRSHAVFQVYIKMTIKLTKEVRSAKLSMIDLAGSERGSATGYIGARFTEGANINKSLLALGNCINSLADGHRHIPYRDSKLTRLLKDSLGGNCQTIMIANISPSSLTYDDTYNTLKYAARASTIKSSVHKNIGKPDLTALQYGKVIEDLTAENQNLKQQLEQMKSQCAEKEKTNSELELRLKKELEEKSMPQTPKKEIDENLSNQIKSLAQQKRDLLERRFQLEKNEVGIALRRMIKEEIEQRLSDVCNTPDKLPIRNRLTSTIMRFKKQEHVFRDQIEKDEDDTDEIDKKLNEILNANPECLDLINYEKLKLDLRRAEHRILLGQKHCELLAEEHDENMILMEKLITALKSNYKILDGHGYATQSISKEYNEILNMLQGRKNIKWNEEPDLNKSPSNSHNVTFSKRKIESPPLNRTFGKELPQVPDKLNVEPVPIINSGKKMNLGKKTPPTITKNKEKLSRVRPLIGVEKKQGNKVLVKNVKTTPLTKSGRPIFKRY